VKAAEHLRVDVRRTPDMTVLTLEGELDLRGVPVLEGELEQLNVEPPRIMVLDCAKLEFIDSAGLRVILTAHERAQESGQELALTKGSKQVQRLLDVAGVTGRLRLISSPEEMLV
jgi:anti-sigma B factor antagonist